MKTYTRIFFVLLGEKVTNVYEGPTYPPHYMCCWDAQVKFICRESNSNHSNRKNIPNKQVNTWEGDGKEYTPTCGFLMRFYKK